MRERRSRRWLLCVLLVAAPAFSTEWQVARGPSSIGFTVNHLVFSEVEGRFTRFSGSAECPGDDWSDATVEVSVEVASIYTGHADRDRQLLTEDFFLADGFPTMTFRSTAIERTGEDRYLIHGDLTIRGTTRPFTLDARHIGTRTTRRGQRADFEAKGSLNRFEFGLGWDERWYERPLVSARVEIRLEVALVRAIDRRPTAAAGARSSSPRPNPDRENRHSPPPR